MPKIENIPMGAPCWMDLSTSDPERAKTFYGGLFGWDAADTGEEFGHYINLSKGDAGIAGMMKKGDDMQGMPDAWTVYLAVPDAKAATQAVRDAGGQVVFDAMEVRDLGSMAVVTDSTGAFVGLWQPAEHRGFDLYGEHGAPAWHELRTGDLDAASAFYPAVLGVEIADMETEGGPRYRTINVDGEQKAGLMDAGSFLPEGVPSHWMVYFGVDDTDAAVATAQELGGSVLAPAEDTPFGRMATVSDPMRAPFNLISIGEEPA
ncbi:MAG: VOC family protein [Chloroflexota bacterium]|nr:VOC family protein [Chloroflexota bacterium]